MGRSGIHKRSQQQTERAFFKKKRMHHQVRPAAITQLASSRPSTAMRRLDRGWFLHGWVEQQRGDRRARQTATRPTVRGPDSTHQLASSRPSASSVRRPDRGGEGRKDRLDPLAYLLCLRSWSLLSAWHRCDSSVDHCVTHACLLSEARCRRHFVVPYWKPVLAQAVPAAMPLLS